MPFNWKIGEPPPLIEPHSEAKLKVLRRYISDYILTLTNNFRREEFKLDLVDGFSGGGIYRNEYEDEIYGSPLVMLDEVANMETQINANRNRPTVFDVEFYFVDKKKNHIDYLNNVIDERPIDVKRNKIHTLIGDFAGYYKRIVSSIKSRQPIAGRSIFLLDQTGFSQVDLEIVRYILNELGNSEVIITIAMDALRNFAQNNDAFVSAVMPLHFNKSQIEEILESKGDKSNGAMQRIFRPHIRSITNATFDTPFFITPETSRRSLWFVHLSKHPKARDVMMNTHWVQQNYFNHVGPGGFGMLGWDTIENYRNALRFDFNDLDRKSMIKDISEQLPRMLHDRLLDGHISINKVHAEFANETAAKFSDMDDVILDLLHEDELAIFDGNGKRKSNRRIKIVKGSDQIALPTDISLFSKWRRIN